MTAHDIIDSSCIFSLLKYDRIIGKNLEHDTCGVKWNPWPRTLRPGGQYQVWSLKFMLVFIFYNTSSSDNIFETETYFGGNVKVFLWHLYTCWTSEGMDITRWLTKC